MTGLHLIEKPLAGGTARWYVYAWRGGPCIAKADGRRPAITPALLDLAAAARAARSETPRSVLRWAIESYRASPEFTRLAASTRRDYRLWLDRIDDRFGTAPLAAFEDRRMRGAVLAWRDGWAAQPRSADKASVMMATLLGWAVQRGMLAINVAAGIAHLHRADRSEIVWTAADWAGIERHASSQLIAALRLAGLTGLRLSDLVGLKWSAVGKQAVVVLTAKRKRRAVIPILPELAELLRELGPDEAARTGTVLKNSRGKAWTASGLGTMFHRARAEAGLTVRIHDLRGTYVTWLAVQGLTDEEIARIVAWSPRAVGQIRHRYVDEARVVTSITERLSRRESHARVNQV